MARGFIKVAACAAAALLALAGCSSTATSGSTTSAAATSAAAGGTEAALTTVKAGTLTVCSDIPYPPFEFEDPNSSGYTGFDIDIINEIAQRLNLKVSVQVTNFDALQSGAALAAGQCDMGVSAITITDERKANLDFADPYYDSLQSLLVKKDSGITSLADLAGKRIGVQTGTTGQNYAKENAPATATLVDMETDGLLWPAIQAGQIDAILQDYPVNLQHEKDDPNYSVIEKYDTKEQYGFALAKGKNPALLAAINTQLKAIRDDGTYQTIYNKYFS